MIAPAASALSGALAQSVRVAGAASNLANQDSTGALPAADGSIPAGKTAAYQPVDTVVLSQAGGGVSATYRPVTPAATAAYDPSSPNADARGLVAAPNVDVTRNIVTLSSASNAYKANLAVFKAADEMQREALNLTA
jgi:flagellar basal-body rod protein FlgC